MRHNRKKQDRLPPYLRLITRQTTPVLISHLPASSPVSSKLCAGFFGKKKILYLPKIFLADPPRFYPWDLLSIGKNLPSGD
jgi:hypothetical protein